MDINPKEVARLEAGQQNCHGANKKETGRKAPATPGAASSDRENPYFNHIHRGPYEIHNLLRGLPQHAGDIKDDETWQRAEAVAEHASNSSNTLVWGMQAIGEMMVDLGTMKNYQMDGRRVAAIGDLVRHLAVELEALKDTEDTITYAMQQRTRKAAKEGF